MLSRAEVITILGGLAGKQALNKMERARPTPTGRKTSDNGLEYCATGNVKNLYQESKSLSVLYSIQPAQMPPGGVFKVRPPALVPIGYLVEEVLNG